MAVTGVYNRQWHTHARIYIHFLSPEVYICAHLRFEYFMHSKISSPLEHVSHIFRAEL